MVSRNPAPPPGVQIPPPPDRDDARTDVPPPYASISPLSPQRVTRAFRPRAAPPGRRGAARSTRQRKCARVCLRAKTGTLSCIGLPQTPTMMDHGRSHHGRRRTCDGERRAAARSDVHGVPQQRSRWMSRTSPAGPGPPAPPPRTNFVSAGVFGRPPRLPSRRQCVDLLIMQQHT